MTNFRLIPRNAKSELEELMARYMDIAGIPEPEREYKFHPKRKWKFDFAWVEKKVALEVEGGIWVRGRHARPMGFIKDCEKYNTAGTMGWKIIRVCDVHIKTTEALDWVCDALGISR